MITAGGLNVYPREVEIVLEGHPSVAEMTRGSSPSTSHPGPGPRT
jgi:acyl-CoA synthetase (AMP-forming)/AMP-acid ligase II